MRVKPNTFGAIYIIYILLIIGAIVGEVKCITKAIRCDWDPIGKAEIIYTAAAFTGMGSIVGWIDIEDVKEVKDVK